MASCSQVIHKASKRLEIESSKAMTTQEKAEALQEWSGLRGNEIDGYIGRDSINSIYNRLVLLGLLTKDDGWKFKVTVDGLDLVVNNCRATCFGGANDPQDSGETASGVSTKPPATLGVALPRNYTGSNKAIRAALFGSPIPATLPFFSTVRVISGSKSVDLPFIDIGPAKRTGNALDLTVAAAKLFNPNASAVNFEMRCNYRILGGAKYLT